MSDNKSCASTNINWYPGHMAKTKKQIEEDLKLVDVVVELLDARIPIASQNPDIAKLTQGKKRILVLNKSDLAEEIENKRWKTYFEKEKQLPTIIVDSNTGTGMREIIQTIQQVMKPELEKQLQKGRVQKNIRIMIVGIPNVGKSSFINRISKRNATIVGNKPGVTKQKQWVRIENNIELLDTPGVLWPKFENETVALHLAFTGTIKSEVIDEYEIAFHLVSFLYENETKRLQERYGITDIEMNAIFTKEEKSENIVLLIEQIAKKRGALLSGGRIDEIKIARLILEDYKTGKFGRITLEKVEEEKWNKMQ